MTEQDLLKGKEILELIKETERALEDLSEWANDGKDIETSQQTFQQKYKEDGKYYIHLSEFSDGTGRRVRLYRAYGNQQLLSTVEAVLKAQLEQFKADFEAI